MNSILQTAQWPAAMQAEIDSRLTTLKEPSPEVTGILTRSNAKLDAELIRSLPHLKVIATCGVGYDGIPLDLCRSRGIAVSNTPGVLNDAVCELAIGLMLSLLRRLPHAHEFAKEGRWTKGAFPLTRSLSGKRIGIVGMGRIGQDLAARLLPFKVDIAYTGPSRKDLPYPFESSVIDLARKVDILFLTCPGGRDTDGLVNASVLEALGPTGYLVNMARGSVVNEPHLIHALQSNTIAGAALDVFADEPNIPEALRSAENVVLSPHVGSATEETRIAMTRLAVDNLLSFYSSGRLLTPVLENTSST
jgi:lactate dehydrogenase-like 2-hydroxyacid dehydrogenase